MIVRNMERTLLASMVISCFPLWAWADQTLPSARANAISWLGHHQNSDGSWGEGQRRWLVTAEALTALSKAGQANALPARRAKGWLLSNEANSVDGRARAIRALALAGTNVTPEAQ